ncbi:PTS sugar transporter subunit IIA [bacterium]|nr:PTS sugar transporter subunit IIA [bacterium]
MKITDILDESCVTTEITSTTKKEVITELVELLEKNKKIKKKDEVVKILLDREKLGSTGIGYGIAIPHGKSDQVDTLLAAFGLCKQGVDFDSLDGAPVNLFFLLITPTKEASGAHLKALAKISGLLKDKLFRQELLDAKNSKEIYSLIKREESRNS